MGDDRLLARLQRLARLCRDAQQGYLEAAEHIGDSRLRAYFNDESLERARYASDLRLRLGITRRAPRVAAPAPALGRQRHHPG